MVVGAEEVQQIVKEVEEAADLIATDNLVYEYTIEEKASRRPANAADYEMDEDG